MPPPRKTPAGSRSQESSEPVSSMQSGVRSKHQEANFGSTGFLHCILPAPYCLLDAWQHQRSPHWQEKSPYEALFLRATDRPSSFLGFTPLNLLFNAPLPGSGRRFCPDPPLWFGGGAAQEFREPLHCVPAVLLLGPKPARIDDQNPFPGQPLARQSFQSLSHVLGDGRGFGRVKTQLYSRGNLVDILPSRT